MKRFISVLLFAAIIAYIGLCAAKQAEKDIADYHSKQESILENAQ